MRRTAFVLLLLCLGMGQAHAARKSTIAVFAVGSVLVAGGLSLAITAAWARASAPGADTLMDFQRRSGLESSLGVPAGLCLIAAVPVLVLGGFSLRRDRAEAASHLTLRASPQGVPFLGLGAHF